MVRNITTLSLFALMVAGPACPAMSGGEIENPFVASATLQPRSGSTAQGNVSFEEKTDGLHVQVQVTGLKAGYHGFHVHEKGDCSATDASSAGDHFSPLAHPHAGPGASARHVGDMGNILADANGAATARFVLKKPDGFDDWKTLAGKAVIVHENKDDLTSQPSGNAGKRIACGVIQLHTHTAE